MASNHASLARTPPMGWSSWDCFLASVTEAEVKANADYMADKLLSSGYEYILVDLGWYNPRLSGTGNGPNKSLVMDEWGRYLPATNRFPSAADGAGFKPLADYVHGKGRKFGIHIMRGIPRQAVKRDLPIHDTTYRAAGIVNKLATCFWNQTMFGIDMKKPGAQEYYNSIFDLYAAWDADYIKVDDCSFPYRAREIEAIRKAIDQSGRQIVFSLSPGPTQLKWASHVSQHANLWRISADFWDHWFHLRFQFHLCAKWAPNIHEGAWPDADMLPLGHVRVRTSKPGVINSRLSREEQVSLMTLFTIFKSPLLVGGHLPDNDAFTDGLLTNPEVMAMHHDSQDNRPFFRKRDSEAWIAKDPATGDVFLALFNFRKSSSKQFTIDAAKLGILVPFDARDLWQRMGMGNFAQAFSTELAPHGAGLFRLSWDKNQSQHASEHHD